MKNPINVIDVEDLVINALMKDADILMRVLDEDSEKLADGDMSVLPAVNQNMRTLTAINEVLLYYGTAGIFDESRLNIIEHRN